MSYRQLLIVPILSALATAVLAAGPAGLATVEPSPDKKVEISTIEPDPQGLTSLTSAELEKLIELAEQGPAIETGNDASNGSMHALWPGLEKGRDLSTIVIGPAGLSTQEQAKLAAMGGAPEIKGAK
jgi:hypothetical protein